MKVYYNILSLQSELQAVKETSGTIGFVPTMGALHKGHISLIQKSESQNDVTVVSIFVNPTQFNDKNDYSNYPRTLENDLKKLKTVGSDIAFIPQENEIYPEPDNRIFDLGGLDKVMEGKFRPGHFNGVVQIVTRLFDIVKPDRAYFGYKDFQQLTIIKFVVKKYHIPVEIISCPIVRETDGLAMSSRNTRLSDSQRSVAVKISQVLFHIRDNYTDFTSIDEIKQYVSRQLKDIYNLEVEYFEIVDDVTLAPVSDLTSPMKKVGCIAVWVGPVRLIDNVNISS